MPRSDDDRNPIDVIAEEFSIRLRAGEAPSIADYRDRHPELSDAIDDLFPTLEMMESLKPTSVVSGTGGPIDGKLHVERLGDYRIVREIGRGGMGIVYEAVQESLERRVALKVLPESALYTKNKLERFHRESRAVAQLHHTNIVPVYGVGEEDGTHYFVMQFIEGSGIDAILRQLRVAPCIPKSFPGLNDKGYFQAVASIGEQVASALSHAHLHGTLHRDIKPGNLILDREGNTWVADFGLAKLDEGEDLTHSGGLLGTLRYSAPEQIDGDASESSDLYSLGTTLYELLALAPAFPESDRRQLLKRILDEDPVPPRDIRPEVPIDLETIVLKAMMKEPQHRYENAAELADDLRRFQRDLPVRARRLSSITRFTRWCTRNRGLATTSLAAVCALVGAGLVGWIGYVETNAALGRESANVELSLEAFEEIFDSLANQANSRRENERPNRAPEAMRQQLGESEAAVLTSILSFYDRFADRNETNERLQLSAAQGYRQVGRIYRRAGDDESALGYIDRSIATLERLRSRHSSFGSQVELALAHTDAADLALDDTDQDPRSHLVEAQRSAEAAAQLANDENRHLSNLAFARCCQLRARQKRKLGDNDGAIAELERSLEWLESPAGRRPPLRDRAGILLDLGHAYSDQDRPDNVIELLQPELHRRGRREGERLRPEVALEMHELLARSYEATNDPRASRHRERIRELRDRREADRRRPPRRDARPRRGPRY